jgi:hypothetical protein
MARAVMSEFESHHPLLNAGVTIDFVFAFAEVDDKTGEPKGDALKYRGQKALGMAQIVKLEDRALGQADAKIKIDGDWWKEADEDERRALLDHELYHFALKKSRRGPTVDDHGRPLLRIREHDVEFGWFAVVAARHGQSAQERVQAKRMMDSLGQFFWPDIKGEPPREDLGIAPPSVLASMAKLAGMVGSEGIESMTISHGGQSVTIDKEAAHSIRQQAASAA